MLKKLFQGLVKNWDNDRSPRWETVKTGTRHEVTGETGYNNLGKKEGVLKEVDDETDRVREPQRWGPFLKCVLTIFCVLQEVHQ